MMPNNADMPICRYADMSIRLAILILLPALLFLSALPARAQIDQWEAEIQAFEAEAEADLPPDGAVLFVGSSSIRMWTTLADDFPSVPVINRGFGGSEIADAIRFADRIVLPYEPRIVLLYAGDNDIANGKSAPEVLADVQRFVDLVHESLPETRIAFIAIKPSIARWKLVDEMETANNLVREYAAAANDRVEYIDIFTPMLGEDGRPRQELFMEDGLHLNDEGYALWRQVVAPFLTSTPSR
jgi:lysophospholipase L1-like esterase